MENGELKMENGRPQQWLAIVQQRVAHIVVTLLQDLRMQSCFAKAETGSRNSFSASHGSKGLALQKGQSVPDFFSPTQRYWYE